LKFFGAFLCVATELSVQHRRRRGHGRGKAPLPWLHAHLQWSLQNVRFCRQKGGWNPHPPFLTLFSLRLPTAALGRYSLVPHHLLYSGLNVLNIWPKYAECDFLRSHLKPLLGQVFL